jgi:hypothetical protein
MFRTSFVHHQEDNIVQAALYAYVFHAFMQAVWQVGGCAPDGDNKIFEICRKQEGMN